MTDAAGEGTFRGTGDVAIRWRRAAPAHGAPRGVVVVVHGYAEHLGRYDRVVDHLVSRGLAVAAVDLRGHGRSGGPRGHCRDFAELVADVHLVASAAAEWWPAAPRVLLGHSMGGLVGFLYLLRHPETVRAGALSAPAFRVPDAGPRLARWIVRVLARLAPRTGLRSRLDTSALSRDPAVGPAYVADPLVHRRASVGFVRALGAAQAGALLDAPRLRVPLLVLQGDADRIVEASGTRDVVARLTCPHELVMLPGYYHEILNEPPAERRAVLDLLDRWVDRWVEPPRAAAS
jgi:acylglycerol lipase